MHHISSCQGLSRTRAAAVALLYHVRQLAADPALVCLA
jgi:hypothetical protein